MATSSLLGIDSDNIPPLHSATGIDSLGPSDASDSGSDSAGAYSDEPDSDTDRFGTGERSSADLSEHSSAQDILPDHIEAMGVDGTDAPDAPDEGMDTEAEAGTDGPAPDQRSGAAGRSARSPLRADDMPQEEHQDGEDSREEAAE
jgi:hypothetical protein